MVNTSFRNGIWKYSSMIMMCLFLMGPIISCEKADKPPVAETLQNINVLRYDVNAPFMSLDPTQGEFSGATNIFPLLYSYLFVLNSDGTLEPDLAQSWTYDLKSLAWTIHLRRDARFHNGQPVNAADVKHSLTAVLNKNRPPLFYQIAHISLVTDSVITIGLKKDDPEFLHKIWDIEIVPHPSHGEKDPHNRPIGSGPFRFKARQDKQQVILEANPDYYHGRPALDGIIFQFQPDKEKAWTRLLSDQTDIAQEISPKNYEMTRQYADRYYFDLYTLRDYTILLYNTADPLFSDLRVRMAMTLAIDREYIVEEILAGMGRVAIGPMGLDSPYHNPETKPVPYNPKMALDLLRAAGWEYDTLGRYLKKQGKIFSFTILVFEESQIEKRVAQYIRLCLNDLGIQVHLKPSPFEELKARYFRNNKFQAALTELTSMGRVPEFLSEAWSHNRDKRSIAGGFDNAQVTRLIHEALEEKDPQKQKHLFYRLEALIISLHPCTFLFHKTAVDVMSKRFQLSFPFSLTHVGIHRLRHASMRKS